MNKSVNWAPWAAVAVAILYLAVKTIQPGEADGEFRWSEAARLPVQDEGRVQPLDTFARVKLLQLSHRQGLTHGKWEQDPDLPDKDILKDPVRISPTQWAVQAMFISAREDKELLNYRIFRIDNEQLVDALKLPMRPGSWRYSFNEFAEKDEFNKLVDRLVEQKGPKKDDVFENKVAELWEQFVVFMKLTRLEVGLVPPEGVRHPDVPWLSLTSAAQLGGENRVLDFYRAMVTAYANNKPAEFNEAVEEYQKYLQKNRPSDYHSARLEAFFNHFEPFYQCTILYGLIFLIGCASWLVWGPQLRSVAVALTILTVLVHTWALIMRIYITGRPPVINLYSTGIFIGWGCVLIGMFLEWLLKNGMGIVVGAVCGLLTLIIAHNLVSGDTMGVLEAVLDTNFWLATHVIAINFGYTAVFVAGFLGIMYIGAGVLTSIQNYLGVNNPPQRMDAFRDLAKMIYGVTCFAVLLSFVGTVLGGIWADESWGRFWGWDPKENGALMIVIWTALVLHARWGGIVKARGLANLAIFGNCVTAWSWFGTNLLGVGLHSYGFMKGAMFWLLVFVLSQLVIIGIGCLPLSAWATAARPTPPAGNEPAPKSSARASLAAPA
ncbi:MAG: cytochrome c biogenesis protein CcsA [Gemmataceae bacterium]|nr:cytochrome c biogenesis protein CcsA [Gemmataceae bacterium]